MEQASTLSVYPVEAGPVATFGYMITDTKHNVAAIIDVPLESAEYFLEVAEQEKVKIESIFLTHSHWDHTGDVAKVQRATGAKVYIHPDDEYRLGKPNDYTSIPLPFTIEPCKADGFMRHGDIITCGGWNFEVRHTPGHTEGGVCFIDHAQKLAFVGDTLFAGSIGRTDLQGGNTETLLNAIRAQLFTLDDSFIALPGHGTHTTIGVEKRTNPFLM
jgi:glyoxylase-like metal-dependent hydrolase (beta-lactamase superfamily II)